MSRPSMLWLYGLIGAFIIGYYVFGDVNDTPVPSDWATVERMVEKGEVEKIQVVNRDQAQVKDAICRAIFALGGVRWFILEGEKEGNDTILFGIVIGLMEDEYGYISLNELSDIELDLTKQGFGKLQVRQQENFHPVPLKKLRDSRLQEFLARMGY